MRLVSEYVTAEAPCGCKWYAAGPPFRCVTHRYIEAVTDAFEVELEVRQNELHLAMVEVEKMPASEEQTACIIRLGERMRKLVELRGKSEVGRSLPGD